ncbi:CPBP family intramembrane glutamic endopeptidase [Fulvivirga aurantia]|uniref:CPBP family intramembrane glutamic endopeptidase n=1 Tax=Fulvivirga aurantia TaxID=2529383 RepID=UPI0012BC02EA|nr:CPBP family intramembrane glutamic endopeptidase [Fulvivirga aurantia]
MTIQLQATLKSLLSFLKSPADSSKLRQLTFKEKFPTIIALLIIGLIASFAVLFLVSFIEEFVSIDLGNHAVEEILKENPVLSAIFGIIIAPILEELLFRSWLTFRRAYFFLWIPITFYKWLNKSSEFIAFKKVKTQWNKIYPFIFYFSALIFGLVHASNFENYMDYLWFAPLITLPQIILGGTFGYVRVKFGLVYSMLLHGLHNLVLLGPVILFT